MDKVEIWEVLVMLSGNEISLKEAHNKICSLLDFECSATRWMAGVGLLPTLF